MADAARKRHRKDSGGASAATAASAASPVSVASAARPKTPKGGGVPHVEAAAAAPRAPLFAFYAREGSGYCKICNDDSAADFSDDEKLVGLFASASAATTASRPTLARHHAVPVPNSHLANAKPHTHRRCAASSSRTSSSATTCP